KPCLFLLAERQVFQQLRPALPRTSKRLTSPPLRYAAVMSRQQHFRHLPGAEVIRSRIMRMLEQAGAERVRNRRSFIAEHARQQADDAVHDDHSRKLAASQYVVADRQFIWNQMLANAFIIAFIMAANKDQMLFLRKLLRLLL